MFRKIVSNLSFSPALVGQLAFYAKRLRKEEATRRIGLVFVALALVVQGLAVFDPSQSANASTSNDFIPGGISGEGAKGLEDKYMPAYDANVDHLKDIMTGVGITRSEITSATYGTWVVHETYSWGRQTRLSAAQGLTKVNIPDKNGKTILSIYGVKSKWINGYSTVIHGWIGHSAHVGWFAIMEACGNLATETVPKPVVPTPPTPPVTTPTTPSTPTTPTKPPVVTPPKCEYTDTLLASSPDCKPCAGSPGIWYKDTTCIPNITESKTATNLTQGNVEASTVTAQASDTISYTISAKNTGLAATTVPLTDNLNDVAEYATLIDAGGGTYDQTSHVLSWPSVSVAPGSSQTRTYVVQLDSSIPATPVGASDAISYDCKMQNGFGNTVTIAVACPTPKVVEQTVTQLPHTGPSENLMFAGIVLAITTYFYLRSRQVGKEIRLIRRDLNAGAL